MESNNHRIYKGHRDWVLRYPNGNTIHFEKRMHAEAALSVALKVQRTNQELDQWVTSYSAQQ